MRSISLAVMLIFLCSCVGPKRFITAHAISLGATSYDVEVTHEGLMQYHCLELNTGLGVGSNPSRGELYRRELSIWAGLTLMDWGFYKMHLPVAPYTGAAVGSAIHIKAGTDWFTKGCL